MPLCLRRRSSRHRSGPRGADGAEAFVGGLLGSAIGTAITNNAQQRQQQQRVIVEKRYVKQRAPRAPAVSSWQREENRRVQTALNYFGFPAGPADGVMGPASRAAAMQYQGAVGFPPTGVLMENERIFLTASYERAVVGGPQAAQVMAASGQGTRGLLLAYRQEQLGIAPPAPMASAAPPAVVPATAPVAPEPAAPAPAAEVVRAATIPSFMPDAPRGGSVLPSGGDSLADLCNSVTMDLARNMGPITAFDVAMDDPDPMQVLDEQFCVARSHAIDQAKSLVAAVEGFTPDEMRSQCEAFAPTMARFTGNLAGRAPAEVNAEVRGFLDGTGAQAAQMSGTARICLGIGYWTDNAELALGSALVLTALGEAAYAELVGFHIASGYGVPADCGCGLPGPTRRSTRSGRVRRRWSPIPKASAPRCWPTPSARWPRPTRPRSTAAKAEPPLQAFALPKAALRSAAFPRFTSRRAFVRRPASAVVAELVDAQR